MHPVFTDLMMIMILVVYLWGAALKVRSTTQGNSSVNFQFCEQPAVLSISCELNVCVCLCVNLC